MSYDDDVLFEPFASERQRRWMHATHPEMAERWERHTSREQRRRLPERKRRRHRHRLSEAFLEQVFLEGCMLDELLQERASSSAEDRARAFAYHSPGGGIGSGVHEPIGRPGGPGAMGTGKQYPPGFQHIRNALIRSGHSVADASRIAWAALRRWASGRGNVKKTTRAKAAKVLAQLDALRGEAHAHHAARAASRA